MISPQGRDILEENMYEPWDIVDRSPQPDNTMPQGNKDPDKDPEHRKLGDSRTML